jgi:redox-sensing transcriptional repressor
LSSQGVSAISSGEIGEKLGVGAHSVRKDVGCVSSSASGQGGYDVRRLKKAIAARFGFQSEYKACVVGLGQLGQALMRGGRDAFKGLRIVAGFDSDVNVVETISADVPVYPSYEITETVKRLKIEIAVLTVPDPAAQETADRLIKGGVKGIMNFTSEHIKTNADISVRNIDLTGEFRVLSALMFSGH